MNTQGITNYERLQKYAKRREAYHQDQIELASLTGDAEEFIVKVKEKNTALTNLRHYLTKRNWMEEPGVAN
tara:strand:+ start:308 stop:520 length:213 start_codon:yes stop_codon:yes gene_type:complete